MGGGGDKVFLYQGEKIFIKVVIDWDLGISNDLYRCEIII